MCSILPRRRRTVFPPEYRHTCIKSHDEFCIVTCIFGNERALQAALLPFIVSPFRGDVDMAACKVCKGGSPWAKAIYRHCAKHLLSGI
jgi:hypothetical protein